jgi:hypothetical protein
MRSVMFVVCGFVVAFLALAAHAPVALAQAAVPADQPGEHRESVPVKARRVLSDGTVQIEYADGTKTIVGSVSPAGGSAAGSDRDLEPVAPPEWLKDPATNEAFLRAMGEYYAYRVTGLQHRRHVFEWQLFSSKVTFLTVLILVASGIVFAAVQFRAGLGRRRADGKEMTTELELATTGLKVSSPVLGVIILLISLAFFYLYLVYVYPISELI